MNSGLVSEQFIRQTVFNHLFRREHDIKDKGMTAQTWKMPTVTLLRISWHVLHIPEDCKEELINLPFHSSLTRGATFRGPEASKGLDENAVLGSAAAR